MLAQARPTNALEYVAKMPDTFLAARAQVLLGGDWQEMMAYPCGQAPDWHALEQLRVACFAKDLAAAVALFDGIRAPHEKAVAAAELGWYEDALDIAKGDCATTYGVLKIALPRILGYEA